jgi:MHS family shikimate/dehydroshikimate transporter-like MFS transporter
LPQAASPAGLLLATGTFALISLLPPAQFVAWGWRVPFLLSILMLGVGLVIRLRIAETPEFEQMRREGPKQVPVMDLLRTHKHAAICATGARLAETVAGNMIKSFGLTYATVVLGLSQENSLAALMATSAVGLAATPFYGWLADRHGARSVYLAGAALAAALAFPFFWLLGFRTAGALWAGFILAYNLGPTMMLSVQPTFFSQLFAARVRYTGLSVAYQVSAIVGGFTPLAALALLHGAGGRPWMVAASLAGVAALSFLCAVAARHAPRPGGMPAGMPAVQDA